MTERPPKPASQQTLQQIADRAIKKGEAARRREARLRTRQDESVAYEPCIVSFIDVLGFRALLRDKSALDIYRILTNLRYFTSPRPERESRRMKDVRLHSRAFSDSVSDAVVRVRVYDTQYRDGAFFHELLDLVHAQIECVNAGVLIRAGVAVGQVHVGLDGKGPVFGPAMVRAFEIESEEAIYPRIVVDDAAYQAFLDDERLRSEDNDIDDEKRYVERLMRTGEDGTRYLDYLRAESEFDDEVAYYLFIDRHAALIRAGLAAAGSARVRRKYAWLAGYHNEVVGALVDDYEAERRSAAVFYSDWEEEPLDHLRAALVAT